MVSTAPPSCGSEELVEDSLDVLEGRLADSVQGGRPEGREVAPPVDHHEALAPELARKAREVRCVLDVGVEDKPGVAANIFEPLKTASPGD